MKSMQRFCVRWKVLFVWGSVYREAGHTKFIATREGANKLLRLLAETREELASTAAKIRSQEEDLNHQVYDLYGLTLDERKIIEDFLARYSSAPAFSNVQAPDEEEDENYPAGAGP